MKKQIIALAGAFALGTAAIATITASAAQVEVKEGDTLWSISQENNVSIESIKKLNSLHSNLILAGSKLEIGNEKSKGQSLYTIRVGDTLSEIAMKTGVSVKNLKAYNKLSGDLIISGTTLALTNENQKVIPGKKPVVKKPVEKKAVVKKEKTTPVSNPVAKTSTTEQKRETQSSQSSAQKTLTMVATAYTADCPGCSGITATGIDVRNSTPNIIAVDPTVIPLGSTVWVEGYGTAIAGDTGGAIKGNRIDLLMADHNDAVNYGVKTVTVKIIK